MSELTVDLSLHDYQKQALQCEVQNIVWVGGRRVGKTTGAARVVLARMLERKKFRALWIDTVYRNILRYAADIFVPLLRQLPKEYWNWNAQKMVISLAGGSELAFGSYDTKQNLEGFGYDMIILNEAGIILWNELFYYNTLRPMGIENKGAQWLYVGTPKGNNLLKTLYERGQSDNEPKWASFRSPSFVNPLIDKELIEEERKEMPAAAYAQEYLAEFRDDANYFSEIDEAFNGQLEEYPEVAISYVIGIDLAKDVDYTVCWVGRADQRRGVYCERHTKVIWPEQVQKIKKLAKRFNNAALYVDATGVGDVAIDYMILEGLNVTPIVFNNTNKTEMMANLATDLEQHRITLCPHPDTKRELKAFLRTPMSTGKFKLEAPAGYHDDCVIALGLMLHGMGSSAGGQGEAFSVPSVGAEYLETY